MNRWLESVWLLFVMWASGTGEKTGDGLWRHGRSRHMEEDTRDIKMAPRSFVALGRFALGLRGESAWV